MSGQPTAKQRKEHLRTFSLAVQREINVRRGDFQPDRSDEAEIRWCREGPVDPWHLDTLREYCT